jgi:hypothetical protein
MRPTGGHWPPPTWPIDLAHLPHRHLFVQNFRVEQIFLDEIFVFFLNGIQGFHGFGRATLRNEI